MSKVVPPSIDAVSFSCPHCGALASQTWYDVRVKLTDEGKPPFLPDADLVEEVRGDKDVDQDILKTYLDWATRSISGEVFMSEKGDYPHTVALNNVSVSRCYACSGLAIWKRKALLFPVAEVKIEPNPDLPEDIKQDFREAESILMLSPRGAAALLRLAIQKLCTHLGGPEKTIDQNIAWLVGRGLDDHVQQALDAVRVIGNEAVHPGELNLSDDVEIASSLFGLVNIIAEEMISRKKRVQAVYDKIPASKRDGIDVRNSRAIAQAKPGE